MVAGAGLPAALNCEFLNTPAKGNPMNNDALIPHIPQFQNPMKDLLTRLDSIDSLNQESVKWKQEVNALLREVVHQQQEMRRQIEQLLVGQSPQP